uniref:ZP domain-containing protein n=1 Tax=Esox lucius TaxID=8010 RepID=A0A6Q2Y5A0_ESOLU
MALQRSATFLFLAWPCFAFATSEWECISAFATKPNFEDAEVNCKEGKDVVHAELDDLEFQSQFEDPDNSNHLAVKCSEDAFEITLPAGPLSGVRILGSKKTLHVLEAPESCGYSLRRGKKLNKLTVRFSGCLVSFQVSFALFLLVIPRSQQVPCGYRYSRISSSRCLAMGCCVDSATSACFYPMDECTADKHFVFIIHHDIATFPVDPANLVVVGKSNCGPVIVSNKFAVFKFSVTRCGTHSYEIGGTVIYTAELQTAVRTLNLKYGVISRDNLLRVMVECRYPREELGSWPAVVRLGYMVKSPSFSSHSMVRSRGLFGVQLRIAQDGSYDTYLEQYHQPLQVLLGKPVYLEVRLMSPRPEATLLVNYCLAYPRSATKALVLIHEGCPNSLDPNISILKFHNLRQNRHRRRFMVQAFQFMDQRSNKYLTEEIYFMCSTEVCMPTERTCKQRCFDGKVRFSKEWGNY